MFFHILIRVCLNEDETFKGYARYYHHCPSLPVVRKLLHFNLFPETTGTIILKSGRSVHLIVLIKVFSSLGPNEFFPSLCVCCLSSIKFSHFDLLKNHRVKLNQILMWYSLNAPLPILCLLTLPNIKDGFSLVEKLEIFENLLQNHWMDWNQI